MYLYQTYTPSLPYMYNHTYTYICIYNHTVLKIQKSLIRKPLLCGSRKKLWFAIATKEMKMYTYFVYFAMCAPGRIACGFRYVVLFGDIRSTVMYQIHIIQTRIRYTTSTITEKKVLGWGRRISNLQKSTIYDNRRRLIFAK